ncbi:PqqD family protein [Nocardioides sp.]|uniref:PqqD family protein n=1 Tax=Nocardioides sp. TaxID=35761 RepID=UPI0035682B67
MLDAAEPVQADRVLRRKDELAVVDSTDRVAILDLDDLTCPPRVLEGTAAAIWQLVDGVRSERDICQELAEAYGAPFEVVADDVAAFLNQMVEAGLLVEAAVAVIDEGSGVEQ